MEKKYLSIISIIILTGFISVGFFNWLINPFSLYESPNITGLNQDKVDFIKHLRLSKPRALEKTRANIIILGTSRAGRGLSSDHKAFENDRVYNLALPGIGIYEMYRYLQHAHAANKLDKVILTLDFRTFHDNKPSSAFSDTRLLVDNQNQSSGLAYLQTYFFDTMSTLFSVDALGASLKNIKQQDWNSQKLFPDGRWDRKTENINHQKFFMAYTQSTIERLKEYSKEDNSRPAGFSYFRNIISFAHENNIELHMAISPSHAWHWQTYKLMGLQNQFFQLKRKIVSINKQIATRYDKSPFPIWDFSGYNSISIEPVPVDKDIQMNWFWESVHYKKSLGDLLLSRIFSLENEKLMLDNNIGTLITTRNIDAVIIDYLHNQEKYELENHDDILRLRKIISLRQKN